MRPLLNAGWLAEPGALPAIGLLALVLATPLWGLSIRTHDWPPVVRDWAVRTLWAIAAVLCWPLAWPLTIIGALVLLHWRAEPDPVGQLRALNAPVTWAAIAATVALVAAVPPAWHPLIQQALVWGALGQLGWLALVALRQRRLPLLALRAQLRGTMGNGVICSAFLALALPFATPWQLGLLGVALLATGSFVGLAAGWIGLLVAYPQYALELVAAGALGSLVAIRMRASYRDLWALVRRRPNVSTPFTDSCRERRLILGLLLRTWATWPTYYGLVGRGHHAFSDAARWWLAQQKVKQLFKQAHCDGAQLLLEYGLLGTVAVVGYLGWALLTHGRLGDPVTAAVVAGLVASFGQFPLHLPQTGLPWLVLLAILVTR